MERGGGLHRLLKVAVIIICIIAGLVFAFNAFVVAVRVPNGEKRCATEKSQQVCLEVKEESNNATNGLGSSVLWLIGAPVLYLILAKFVFIKPK